MNGCQKKYSKHGCREKRRLHKVQLSEKTPSCSTQPADGQACWAEIVE